MLWLSACLTTAPRAFLVCLKNHRPYLNRSVGILKGVTQYSISDLSRLRVILFRVQTQMPLGISFNFGFHVVTSWAAVSFLWNEQKMVQSLGEWVGLNHEYHSDVCPPPTVVRCSLINHGPYRTTLASIAGMIVENRTMTVRMMSWPVGVIIHSSSNSKKRHGQIYFLLQRYFFFQPLKNPFPSPPSKTCQSAHLP